MRRPLTIQAVCTCCCGWLRRGDGLEARLCKSIVRPSPPSHIRQPFTQHTVEFIRNVTAYSAWVRQDGSVLVVGYQFVHFNVEPGADSGRRR